MPQLALETSTREKPLLLLVGKNPLLKLLSKELEKDFKIAFITDEKLNQKSENFYVIETKSAHLVKNLEEKIDYAIIFLEDSVDRSHIPAIFEKLISDRTKTEIIIDIEKTYTFYDIILEYKNQGLFYFLLLGQVYSEKISHPFKSAVSTLIDSAVKNHTVTLTGNDLEPVFPIYYKDALAGINQILLGPQTKQKFYNLFYSHPQTYISAIHTLKRVEPDLEIQYGQETGDSNSKLSHETLSEDFLSKIASTPSFLDKYFIGFEKSVEHFQNYKPEETEPVFKEPEDKPKKTKQKTKKYKFFKPVIIAVLAFILINFALGLLSFIFFEKALSDLNQKNYKDLPDDISKTEIFLNTLQPLAALLPENLTFFKINNTSATIGQALEVVNILKITAEDLSIANNIQSGINKPNLDKLIADTFYIYFESQKLKQNFKNQPLTQALNPELSKILSLGNVTPRLLGYDKEKNYLLLFQNNGELRPNGGFIGSIGKLTVSQGKIISITLDDVYNPDGKLKAHVEPNYIIRRYIQPHLYLRDSNFDLDFQNSAATAALIYNLETGQKVDGVIAINFDAVKKIIAQVGPIKLPDYNKTIDENNAFDFLQNTIDDKFFPGSTAKKDVLQSLFNQLVLSNENNRNNVFKIASIIPDLLKEKDILFAFNTNSIQSVFSANGYGGDLVDKRIVDVNTVPDFLSINEANIGVNKANIKVDHKTNYTTDLSGSQIHSIVTHTIINKNADKNYKAYIRIVTPLGSNLSSIKIDGLSQNIVAAVTDFKTYEARDFKAPTGLEVDNSIEDGKQIFGFITNVLPAKTQDLEISYQSGAGVPNVANLTYSLLLVKQPGVESYPFTLKINYGAALSPESVENATLDKGTVELSKNILQDETFTAQFIKKQPNR